MQQLKKEPLFTQPDMPTPPLFPSGMPPRSPRRGLRTTAIIPMPQSILAIAEARWFDLQGNLVGIPTLSAIDPQFQTPANGVGFAIPSNRVRVIVPQLIQTGKVMH